MSEHVGIRFKTGDAFPADDQLARWMTVCLMALNDVLYVNRLLVPRLKGKIESEDYENVYLAQIVGGHLFEIAKFLDHAHRRIPEIAEFTDALDPEPRAAYEQVKAIGPNGSSDFAKHLRGARGQVFHYSALVPQAEDREALKAAMTEHAETVGEIHDVSPPITGFRARFADDIRVEATFGDQPLAEPEYVTQVSEHIAAYLEFAKAALRAYVQRLPRESWEYIEADAKKPRFGRPIAEFSDDELRAYAWDHVRYEITHFVRGYQAVETAKAGNFPKNFAIEVFALHLRNLLDFFAPRNMRATDACARHFYPGWEPAELNAYLDEARRMADKHIAHLTTDRTDDIDLKTWAVEPILRSMIPIIERFTDGAELVGDEFRGHVRDRLAEIPPPRDPTELPPGPDLAPT